MSLCVNNISKSYGNKKVVDNLSFIIYHLYWINHVSLAYLELMELVKLQLLE